MSNNSTELTVLGLSIQTLYNQYAANSFVVNRRYQRKLVWDVEEKQSLIDSVRVNLPIPLVLLAESASDVRSKYEIIDGLQRLNAIFSFIENEYTYDGKYFDLETLADTKFKRDNGEFTQKYPQMDRQSSLAIVNYQLPVSTYRSASTESVDEVFRRINSSGRKLSLQEIRQAGVTSNIASIVRRLSADVRSDATLTDLLPLSEMPKISITNRDLEYGIVSDEVFWVKNGILDKEAIRESRDEELVLDIVLDMVLDPVPVSGTAYRNAAYGRGENSTTSTGVVASRILSVGVEEIESRFIYIFDLIAQSILESENPWASWVITQQNPRGIPRYFHAMFISIYELVYSESLKLNDLSGLTTELHKFWDRDLQIPSGGNWGANRKRPLFESIKAQLRPYFAPDDDPIAVRTQETATEFEVQLQMALTEDALFELKQGFLQIQTDATFDENSFEKVLRTASAMANCDPGATGFIIFGVADREEHASRIADIYGITPERFGEFYVVGTSHELSAVGYDRDNFMRSIIQKIKNSKLEQSFSAELARTLTLFDYHGKLMWTLRPTAQADPVSWDGDFYIREGSSTVRLRGQDVVNLTRRFREPQG